jgi:hypothetical protein
MNDNAALDAEVIELDLERDIRERGFRLFHELQTQSNKEWLVHNLLGHGEASVMYGKPGDGKSVLAEDLGLHIAAGMAWHGRAVRRGTVLYVALERRKLVERRAIAFRERYKPGDLPFAIVGGVHDFRVRRTAQHFVDLVGKIEQLTAERTTLIQIDTLSRGLCGGDENAPKDMGAIVSTTGFLQEKTGAHVMWVHHVPIDGERLRGHGALLGALDTTVHVFKEADGTRTATVVKANDSEEGEGIAFTLESIEVGEDADGNPTTAPIVLPEERNPRAAPRPRRQLSPKHELAVRTLNDLAAEQGAPPPATWGLPNGIATVPVEEWRKTLLSRGVLHEDEDRRRFWDLKDRLKAKNLLSERDGLIWSIS